MNKNIEKIIANYFDDKISGDDVQELIAWIEEGNEDAFNQYVTLNFSIEQLKIDKKNNQISSWERIASKINKDNSIKVIPLYKKTFYNYAIVASIVLLISIAFFIKNEKGEEVVDPIITNNNIQIGTDKAILTLEDGTVVALEKGEHYIADNLESDGEVLIYKIPNTSKTEIVYNYLTIPRGGQYHIVLSDGTEVWLNSESQIKYPVTFSKGETRVVELVYGEAYFDVSPSTDHNGSKFKVLTETQEIEVLGTEFNISAYKEEKAIYTTLIKGKVAVTNGKSSTVLSPSQQSIIIKEKNGINVVKADVSSVSFWRKGVFSFNKMSLENIMKVLARWYNIDVSFVNTEIKNEQFTGVLRKNQNIEDILNSIQTTNNMTYEIKNNTIIFK